MQHYAGGTMRFIKCALATSIATLSLGATAQAGLVTVGPPLTASYFTGAAAGSGTLANVALASGNATSPVTGAIVRWHLIAAEGSGFRLRVLHPAGGAFYTATGSSPPATALTPSLETFSTVVPIQAGDLIGVDINVGLKLGFSTTIPGSTAATWVPAIGDGTTQAFTLSQPEAEVAFNAEVQPQPTVSVVGPTSGPFEGGTSVTIAGTDFAGVTAVKFGTKPAASYALNSEAQITAVAPAGTPGTADVTVTTVAGTSPVTAADRFKYTGCLVPKLKGKKLKAAKKSLKKAECKVGKVAKEDGVTAKTGKVVGQSPKPGKKLKARTKVNVTLG
jgi:hypothetical protein